jgi:NADH:ubiquinone oxidoreductase subunit H
MGNARYSLLKALEQFGSKITQQTAFCMLFIGVIVMELAVNVYDFIGTGGKAAFNTPTYWLAFVVALVAGFLAPLTYNNYKL